MEFNLRKYHVLEYVDANGAVTSQELSDALNLEIHNARMLLLKYHRQGLLNRSKKSRGEYVYELTGKGWERMKWLENQFAEENNKK